MLEFFQNLDPNTRFFICSAIGLVFLVMGIVSIMKFSALGDSSSQSVPYDPTDMVERLMKEKEVAEKKQAYKDHWDEIQAAQQKEADEKFDRYWAEQERKGKR